MRIAAYQFAVSGNISENYKEIEKAIYIAKTENVRLLIFTYISRMFINRVSSEKYI